MQSKLAMDYKRFSLAFFIMFCFSAYFCNGDDAYITWEDLEFDGSLEHDNEGKFIVVSKDGTGDSTTVQGAVDLVPNWNKERVKILIKPGVYRERVKIEITKPYISFIGTNKANTIISYNLKAKDRDPNNGLDIGTYNSTSVSVEAGYFCAKGITFENTVSCETGEDGMQAVALRLSGDKALLYDCNILGSQDTLFDHQGKHFFLNCFIQGTVDFIFGNAASLYQNCILQTTTDGYGAVAASKRISPSENTGYSFVNCTLRGTGLVYLGRAWGSYSRIIYSYCDLNENVVPEGWNDWGDSSRRSTVSFGEYKCTGSGADSSKRVKWARGIQSYDDVKPFLDQSFINGAQWLRL